MKEKKKYSIGIRLSKTVLQKLDTICAVDRCSRAEFLRDCIDKKYLSNANYSLYDMEKRQY